MDHIAQLKVEMFAKAKKASDFYLTNTLRNKDGYPYGDAWVEVTAKHPLESDLGKTERADLTRLGFKLDAKGRKYKLDNPGRIDCNNIGVKIAGAGAVATLLSYHGFRVAMNHLQD